MSFTRFRLCLAAAVSLAMIACVPVAYQAQGEGGFGGYSESKIDPTTWSVTFKGNGNNSTEEVFVFWLYRCAEITVREGYTHFVRVDKRIGANGPAGHVVGHRWGGMIHDLSGEARIPVKGGGGMIFIPMYGGPAAPMPQSYGVVRLFQESEVPEAQKGFAYNAAEVLRENEARVKPKKPAG